MVHKNNQLFRKNYIALLLNATFAFQLHIPFFYVAMLQYIKSTYGSLSAIYANFILQHNLKKGHFGPFWRYVAIDKNAN